MIVMPSADLDLAASDLIKSAFGLPRAGEDDPVDLGVRHQALPQGALVDVDEGEHVAGDARRIQRLPDRLRDDGRAAGHPHRLVGDRAAVPLVAPRPAAVGGDERQERHDRHAVTSWRAKRSERATGPTRIASEAAEHFWPAWPNALLMRSPSDPLSEVGPVVEVPSGKLQWALTTLEEGEQWLVAPREVDGAPPAFCSSIASASEFACMTPSIGPKNSSRWVRDPGRTPTRMPGHAVAYGLTAGLYTQSPADLELWLDQVQAGNLYVNRGITGAIVQRHVETAQMQGRRRRATRCRAPRPQPDEVVGATGLRELWLDQVQAGNLYVNRGITGAIVQRQPFGGWKRSSVGAGTKAGGPKGRLRGLDEVGDARVETAQMQGRRRRATRCRAPRPQPDEVVGATRASSGCAAPRCRTPSPGAASSGRSRTCRN
jgi:hypothetical protein